MKATKGNHSNYPAERHAAASFTGVLVALLLTLRAFFKTRGEIAVENGRPIVRRDDGGRLLCAPIKTIRGRLSGTREQDREARRERDRRPSRATAMESGRRRPPHDSRLSHLTAGHDTRVGKRMTPREGNRSEKRSALRALPAPASAHRRATADAIGVRKPPTAGCSSRLGS